MATAREGSGAAGEAGPGRVATQAVFITVAGFSALPLDLVVVENDVEVTGSDIRAIDQDQLEAVAIGMTGVAGVIVDIDPVDAKGRSSFEAARAIAHRVAGIASIDVGKEGRDDFAAGGGQVERRVFAQGLVKGDVAVVVDIELGASDAEEIHRETDRQQDAASRPRKAVD